MLKQKQYKHAAKCFQKLFDNNPKNLSFLRNQAIIHRMWSQSLSKTNPAKSCDLLKQTIALFKQYQKHTKGVALLEISVRITKLQKQLGLGSLSISTNPGGARLTLVGYRFQKQVMAPHIFTQMCPGQYTLQVDKKEYFPQQRKLQIKRNQSLAKTLRLKPKNLMQNFQCPADIRLRIGPKGCHWWRKCHNKSAKHCIQIAEAYRKMRKELSSVRYLSLACRFGDRKSCLKAGLMHESMSRYPDAIRFYTKACRQKESLACHNLGEIFALREKNRSRFPQRVKRNCKMAIIYYHRACKYGRKASCQETCNTTSMIAPVVAHIVGHVGGFVAFAAFSDDPYGVERGILGYGSLTLLASGLVIPLWYYMTTVHSLGLMLGLSALALAPIVLGLALWGVYKDNVDPELGRLGLGMLFFAAPIHAFWMLFGWMSFAKHLGIAKQAETDKYWDTNKRWNDASAPTKLSARTPIQIYWSPVILKNGAGFVLGGLF